MGKGKRNRSRQKPQSSPHSNKSKKTSAVQDEPANFLVEKTKKGSASAVPVSALLYLLRGQGNISLSHTHVLSFVGTFKSW